MLFFQSLSTSLPPSCSVIMHSLDVIDLNYFLSILSLFLMDPGPSSCSQQGPSSWHMIYGMDLNTDKGLLLVADNFGFLYL